VTPLGIIEQQEGHASDEWCEQIVSEHLSDEERKVVEELKRTVSELEDRLDSTKSELLSKLDEQTRDISASIAKMHSVSVDTNTKMAEHLTQHKFQDPRIDRLSRSVGNLRRWKIKQETLTKSARHSWQGYAALAGFVLSLAGVVAAFWLAVKAH
jgi:hypothetical protein